MDAVRWSLAGCVAAAALAGAACTEPEVPPFGPADVPPPRVDDSGPGCVGEAEIVAEDAARAPADACCAGLSPVAIYKESVTRFDQCFVAEGRRFTCVRCGDRRCGEGENPCNCPLDCTPR